MTAATETLEAGGAEQATALRVLASIDLTSLEDARDDDVAALCAKAVTAYGPVAAVCSWSDHVETMARQLDRTPPRIAAVVNFPGGDDDVAAAVEEAGRAVDLGADELDLVWPYRAWLDGRRDAALKVVTAVRAAGAQCVLKVILETGAFDEDAGAIGEAGTALIEAGADMLKTSTGKIPQGASPLAARALLEAIARSAGETGFKASGGIRSLEEAAGYLALADEIMGRGWAKPATFRIGASRLLDDVLAVLGGSPSGEVAASDGY